MTVSDRFGLVIATDAIIQLMVVCQDLSWSEDLPLSRRFSPRKPTSPSELLRTKVTMTASFSRP